MKYFFLHTFTLLTILSQAQKTSIQYLGVTEPHYNNWDRDKIYPNIIRNMFKKAGPTWSINTDNIKRINCQVGYSGKILGNINSKLLYEIDTSYFRDNYYAALSKKIPQVGKKSRRYSGFIDESIYRPLVVNTKPFFLQKNILTKREATEKQLSLIKDYIFDEVAKNNLGIIKTSKDSIIGKVLDFYTTNKDITLIKLNVHFNMYVVKNRVPLAYLQDTVLDFDTLNNYSTLENNIHMYELQGIHHKGQTPNAWFIIKNDQVEYLDYNLDLLDYGDYDNNGTDEIIFKMEKYNNDGYLLLYDNFAKTLLYQWSYH